VGYWKTRIIKLEARTIESLLFLGSASSFGMLRVGPGTQLVVAVPILLYHIRALRRKYNKHEAERTSYAQFGSA
jgi:hypothetical protein